MAGKITCPRHGRQVSKLVSVSAWSKLGPSEAVEECEVEGMLSVLVLIEEAPATRTWASIEEMQASVATFPVCSACVNEKGSGGSGPFTLADTMAAKAEAAWI